MSWRTPITLLVLLCVLVGAAFYGWQTIVSPDSAADDTDSERTPRCARVERFAKGQEIRSADITVNVYNAGAISGLANDTLAVMTNRGFRLGIAGNAPRGVSATNVTILTDSRTAPQVRLVAKQFKGAVRFAKARKYRSGVSVVVGDQFVGIDQKAERSLVVKRPVRVCIPAND